MGLDCYVRTSTLGIDEIQAIVDKAEENNTYYDAERFSTEIWYGRKTHAIMSYLLQNYSGDDNCVWIPIDDFTTEQIEKLWKREVIVPSIFNEYERDCLKELVDALKKYREEDEHLYFYAWY